MLELESSACGPPVPPPVLGAVVGVFALPGLGKFCVTLTSFALFPLTSCCVSEVRLPVRSYP